MTLARASNRVAFLNKQANKFEVSKYLAFGIPGSQRTDVENKLLTRSFSVNARMTSYTGFFCHSVLVTETV